MNISTYDVCKIAGVSEKQFGMWLRRGSFTPDATRLGKGNARSFTPADVKHLYLVGHLTSLGVSPTLAEAIWRQISGPEDLYLNSRKIALILPGNRLQYYTVDNLPDVSSLPPVAVVVRVAELYAAADAALATEQARRASLSEIPEGEQDRLRKAPLRLLVKGASVADLEKIGFARGYSSGWADVVLRFQKQARDRGLA